MNQRYFFLAYCAIIGDGSCDAEAAIANCNFDEGDCSSTICIIYNYILTTDFISMFFEDQSKNALKLHNFLDCPAIGYIGDLTCDDENNVEECDWDGMDCCVDKEHLFCIECKCHL